MLGLFPFLLGRWKIKIRMLFHKISKRRNFLVIPLISTFTNDTAFLQKIGITFTPFQNAYRCTSPCLSCILWALTLKIQLYQASKMAGVVVSQCFCIPKCFQNWIAHVHLFHDFCFSNIQTKVRKRIRRLHVGQVGENYQLLTPPLQG